MLQHVRVLILLFLSLSKTNLASPAIGFKVCDPDKDGPSCSAAGKYGEICSDSKPCERGYYCKQRSPDMFICDSGVEATHEKLKHLVAGCLDANQKEPGLELTSYDVNKILTSYYLSDAEKEYLENEKHLSKRSIKKNLTFCSIQERATEVCDGKEICVKPSRLSNINIAVVDDIITEQTKLLETNDSMVIYRTDERPPSKLREQGGLFTYTPLSLEHARVVAPLLASYLKEDNLVAELTKFGDNAPFLLTSTTHRPHKSDKKYDYLLHLPIATLKQGNDTSESRQLIYNGDSLDNSQIIGIRAGNRVAFLTGLSAEFVKSVDRNDGDGFLPINKALKEDISFQKEKHYSSDLAKEKKVNFGFIQPPSSGADGDD